MEDVGAAVDEYERLKPHELPALQRWLLHGRLKPADKEAVMARLRRG